MVAAGGCARLGPVKLVLQIYKVDVLLKMHPDPVQRLGQEIGGHMLCEVGYCHEWRCIQYLPGTRHVMFNTMSCSTCYVVSNNSKTNIANKDEVW